MPAVKIEFNRILCPTDFSKSADYAVEHALAIAKRHGATVELMHVTELSAYDRDAVNDQQQTYMGTLEDRLKSIAEGKEDHGVGIQVKVVEGIDYKEIVDRSAAWPADLIVLGTHGRTGFKHLLIGSVAERVVRTAPCAVCTVRHPDHRMDI